jgi:MOSC domain-containing protein YiiM
MADDKRVLVQLSVSLGGIPKLPVESAFVGVGGVTGDRQNDSKHHGGPDRAVCLFSEELYAWLREQGVEVAAGGVGENFTTRGVDLDELTPGDRLAVGACVIEITKVRNPCGKLRKWHPRLKEIITGHSGWVARVIREGVVRPGDAIEVLRREANVEESA